MQKSLYWKLTLAFILVAFTTAALGAIFIRVTSVDRLSQLIIDQQLERMEQALASYYTTNGSWEGVEQSWWKLMFQPIPSNNPQVEDWPPPFTGGPPERDRRSLFGLAAADGTVIVAVNHDTPPGSMVTDKVLRKGFPIKVDGQTVGTILIAQRQPAFNPAEAQFLERTTQALILAMAGALVVALTIGILLARTLTRPLKALTDAAQNIAQGQLEQQVVVNSEDEIGQLAKAFNRMSQEVARVNQLRRQMTADIAHDLRTPLTVIGGYVESMRDGILQPTPKRLALIYAEIERLQHLVNDLRMLSMVDAGELALHPQPIDPRQLLWHAAEIFQHHARQQEVGLSVIENGEVPTILVDEARMMQVMDNLISNAMRYTPSGGQIQLTARQAGEQVEISVKDTGEGISPEDLPHIFNRFQRGEKSRHSEAGESGLGLSIVKALVEAHHGHVWAESKVGEGTTVLMQFPAAGNPAV